MDVLIRGGVGELESESQDGSKGNVFFAGNKRNSVLARMASAERLEKKCRMHKVR